MAKGHDRHQARKQAVARLGRELSRRARSSCELCGANTPLKVIEIEPLPEEPDPEFSLLLCLKCQPLTLSGIKIEEPKHLQFLHESVWSEIQPVQILSVRLARKLAHLGEDWAQSILDCLYLSPEIEQLI